LQLSGYDSLKSKSLKELKEIETKGESKWNKLEHEILYLPELGSIIEFIDLHKPLDWNYDLDKYNIYNLKVNIDGYTPFTIYCYYYNHIWNVGKYYTTTCLVCGEYRAYSLHEILSLAWTHYVHI
jgi:hypothetical protein